MSQNISVRAAVLTRRTYNRPLNEEGTLFETWPQTIARVKEHQRWLWARALGDSLTKVQEEELDELEVLLLNRMMSVAGRTLWLGGTELSKRREISQFNPCRKTTKFITKQGIKSFEDFKDGDKVEVLTHLGNWKSATVNKAGRQPVNKITFKKGKQEYVEYFTPTHTWILFDETRTQALKIDDIIYKTPVTEKWSFEIKDSKDNLLPKDSLLIDIDTPPINNYVQHFRVSEIVPQGDEEVWCLNVEDDHSFVLPNGIVTGNCSALEIRTVHDVVDAFWLLLNGSGVGFKPIPGNLSGFTRKMEVQVIRSTRTEKGGEEGSQETYDPATKTWTIKIGDSAESWAKAIGKIIAGKFPAKKLIIDLGELRPGGKRLKGYGWICAGDGPLAIALEAVCVIMNNRAGKLLSKIDILDIINWLGTVLSSRRSAQICFVDYGSEAWMDFATAKFDLNKHWHRSQSNNSLMFHEKPSKKQLKDIFQMMLDGGGSEPGFVNFKELLRRAPYAKLLNPCFAADTLIVTKEGAYPIEELVGKVVDIWDGKSWREVDNFSVTGYDQAMLKIDLQDGSVLRVTPYHKMILEDDTVVEARDLVAGNKLKLMNVEYDGPINELAAYIKGFLIGDGTNLTNQAMAHLYLYDTKYSCSDRILDSVKELPQAAPRTNARTDITWMQAGPNRMRLTGLACRPGLREWCGSYREALPREVFRWNRKSKCEFLAGLFDADGTILDSINGYGYQLSSIRINLLRDVQTLLKSIGVRSKLSLMRKGGKRKLPTHKPTGEYKEYETVTCWRLTIAQASAIKLSKEVKFSRLKSFADRVCTYSIKSRAGLITNVEKDGVDSVVYCCTVPKTNSVTLAISIVVQQCSEILLTSYGLCNLVELPVCKWKNNHEGMHRAMYLLARANYRQTLVNLRDGILQDSWHQNNEYIRLCGIGLTGIARSNLKSYDYKRLYNTSVYGTYSIADELDLPRPANNSCSKPSGSLSKAIFETTEGVHNAIAKHIFNNIVFSKHDPLVQILLDANYHIFDHPHDKTSVLIRLPVPVYDDIKFTNHNGLEIDKEPALVQMERYKMLQENYVDQNTSITISYEPHEVPQMIDWYLKNWDCYVANAFMLRQDVTRSAKEMGYAYLPQEVVTKKAYDDYNSKLLPVELGVDGSMESPLVEECIGGSCPIR